MRIKDIKILWGRSGNRCSICKIELTPDSGIDTIGEIAHIVSRSKDGPRGQDPLPKNERDDFSNLILLCPNHHSEIDKFPESWPKEKIHEIKRDHEKWVSKQLENGRLSFKPIDNSLFLGKIQKSWASFSKAKIWVVSSLTPLKVDDESVNPLNQNVIDTINSVKLPYERFWEPHLNHYDTRPDENGITNLKLKNINKGFGHKISIYRNGHCEFLFCLDASVNDIAPHVKDIDSSLRVIRYTHIAEVIIKQITALRMIWRNCLQFKNMTYSLKILNIRDTVMFSKEKEWGGGLYGYPVHSENLQYSFIVEKDFDLNEINEIVLKRTVNYFGLILDNVFSTDGKFVRPENLMS